LGPLGANTGEFSRVASNLGIPTIAFDIDHGAVQRNYAMVKQDKETDLLPLCLDLTNPSPSLGWNCQERMSLPERAPVDMVMALALVHHLAISNKFLWKTGQLFCRLGRWLIVEFIPKSDSQVKRLVIFAAGYFPGLYQSRLLKAFRDALRDFGGIPDCGVRTDFVPHGTKAGAFLNLILDPTELISHRE
jgi:hypothetical protein